MENSADSQPIPRHIAIIMDGNGRWAQERSLPRSAGHKAGAETLANIALSAQRKGIAFLTVYAFSSENWQRPAEEVSSLMSLMAKGFLENKQAIQKHNIRICVIGDYSDFEEPSRKAIEESIQATASNTGLTLTIALGYSARASVIKAIKAYVATEDNDPKTLDWEHFSKNYLETAFLPNPDLIIRSSGESRLSNFLLLEAAYSELFFTPALWPDFSESDLEAALSFFNTRKRRFGKTSEQFTHQ